jgi:hypothetical protein
MALLQMFIWLKVERRKSMFGEMNVVSVVDLGHTPEQVSGSVEEAVARLLDVTEHPKIEKWVQFPKALFVFLVVPGDQRNTAL